MANVFDVAKYILKNKTCDNLKLQKLVYYAQAIHLVLNEKNSLFKEDIEAWRYGPVVKPLYDKYKGYGFDDIISDSYIYNLEEKEIESIDCMLDFYGDMESFELVQRTHLEKPWLEAYIPMQNNIITLDSIYNFYKDIFIFEQ